MKVIGLSATSADTYLNCPARWNATYAGDERPGEIAGVPAMKGTVCHAALERFIADGWYLVKLTDPHGKLIELLDVEYWKLFTTAEHLEDCRGMLTNWLLRTPDEYWTNRRVVSTERKDAFPLFPNDGVPFTYICDRVDVLPDGIPEVTDYKTYRAPVQPEEMKGRIQVQAYAVAAMIEFPKAPGVWVTYDLLRYDRVSVYFTREECRELYKRLRGIAKAIHEDEGKRETINADCQYCIRKHECKALLAHVRAGGVLGITDPDEAAERLFEVEGAIKALRSMQTELADRILDYCHHEDILNFTTDTGVAVTIGLTPKLKKETVKVKKGH